MSSTVAVYGATGHTGRFVAAELVRRGIKARLVGRNLDQLKELGDELGNAEIYVASVEDGAALDHALANVAAVINCAGPFFDTNRPIIEAALRLRIHYLDVTAEQVTTLDSFNRYDVAALNAGIVVMPAVAFYGGLADLLVSALAHDGPDVDEVQIAIALDFWHPTVGTRRTGERNTAARLIIQEGQLAPVPMPLPQIWWEFPKPFDRQELVMTTLSEIVTISRHINARSMTSYMNIKPLQDLRNSQTPPPQSVDALGRSAQRFVMEAVVIKEGHSRRAVATGQDIYAVTAPLVVEACMRLIETPAGTRVGARSLGEIFNATEFLSTLKSDIQTNFKLI
jgi:saccharopine dehydrogenase-like NADP-dependent oxidoreductase